MKGALQNEIDALPWFHQIDFGNGIRTPGSIRAAAIERMERRIFGPLDLAGKSVLDIGCWDGAYALAAMRRGAGRVLATDHYAWHEGPGDRRSFDLLRSYLAPAIEVMDAPVEELTEDRIGSFDVVLFMGVFYHLRHPFAVLEQVAKLARDVLVVESRITSGLVPWPVMRFHPGRFEGDPTNWWTPNRSCMEALLRDSGFGRIRFSRPDRRFRRGMFHAWR